MATFYFNGAVDGDWQTLGNWWMDAGLTTQASALPTSADSVIAVGNIYTNSGSEPTVVNFTMDDPGEEYVYNIMSVSVTVTGTATFNGSSANNLGTVNGDAVFNDYSSNYGIVSGNATFNDSSSNYGTVSGNAVFNDNSFNDGGIVSGNATFNGNSYNNYGTVNGTATFNDASYTTPGVTIGTLILGTRTPYPLRYGINNSNILGMI